jgi:ABC-2 type transport system ATP-binding protein
MQKVIEVKNLQKTYRLKTGEVFTAVNQISFDVNQGEIFGILGPNGAGKSTTLEIIEGLKTPDAGQVEVLGLVDYKKIKQLIGIQLQTCEYLPNLTLKELLNLFGAFYNHKTPATDLLKLVNLENKTNEYVKNLSGGQKQRFTIATALINQPKILFLDEPTTGLDPSARRNLWTLIKHLNQTGITIILTTHYMEEAEYLCNRVAIMDQGQILKINEPRKLIEELKHTVQISFLADTPLPEQLFTKMPEVNNIFSAFPKIILDVESLDAIATILSKLKTAQINFSAFTVKTANLEDVYLQLTGHEFEE